MKIQFEPRTETISAFNQLLKRNPNETPDSLINRLIQDAAKVLEPQLDKDELQGVSTRVTAFIAVNHKPLRTGNLQDYLDICYKRGIISKDYSLDRVQLHRVCKWIMDDLTLHPKFRSMTHVVPHAFIRDH